MSTLKTLARTLSNAFNNDLQQINHPWINQGLMFLQWVLRFSLFFKSGRWSIWEGLNDQFLDVVNSFGTYCNITMIIQDQQGAIYFFVLVAFVISILIYPIVIFGQSIGLRKAIVSQIVHSFFVAHRWIMFIPIFSLFCQILQAQSTQFYVLLPFVLIGGTLLITNSIIGVLLLRKNWFGQERPLVGCYTTLYLLVMVQEGAIIILQNIEGSSFLEYVELIILLMLWITCLILELSYPTVEPYHELMLGLQSVGLVNAICISAQLFVGLKFGHQNTVCLSLIVISFSIRGIHQVDQLLRHLLHSQLLDEEDISEHTYVSLVEQIFWKYKQAIDSPMHRIELVCLYQHHRRSCQSIQCKQSLKKLLKENGKSTFSKKVACLVILCIIQTKLRLQKANFKFTYHYLNLVYVSFLYQQCKSPVIAFIELKSQMSLGDWYFKFIFASIDQNIARRIQQSQLLNQKLNAQTEQQALEVKDIKNSYQLEEQYTAILLNILDLRAQLWQRLLNGIKEVDELSKLLIALGRKIRACDQQISKDISIDISQYDWQREAGFRIYDLKILLMYYCSVKTDSINSKTIALFIDETLKYERTITVEKILNSTIVDDKAILIESSIHKQRGQIRNKNRLALANFFGYKSEIAMQHIQHINQLMPRNIAFVHDHFIDDFVLNGTSKLFNVGSEVFLKTAGGCMVMARLSLANFFEVDDDYVLTASLFRIKENITNMIFDGSGKVLGVSEGFYSIVNDIVDLSMDDLYATGQAFFLIPQLFEMLDRQKAVFQSTDQDFQEEISMIVCFGKSITQIMQKFHSMNLWVDKGPNKKIQLEESEFQSTKQKKYAQMLSRLSSSKQESLNRIDTFGDMQSHIIRGSEISLYNPLFRKVVNDFLNENSYILSNGQVEYFQARFTINLKIIENSKAKFEYFVVEFKEFKKMSETLGSQSNRFRTTIDQPLSNVYETSMQFVNSFRDFQRIFDMSMTFDIDPNVTVSAVSQMGIDRSDIEVDLQERSIRENRVQFKHPQKPSIFIEIEEFNDFEEDFKELGILSNRANYKPEMKFIEDQENNEQQIPQSNSLSLKMQNSNNQIVKFIKEQQIHKQQSFQIDQQEHPEKNSRTSSQTSSQRENGIWLIKSLQQRKVPTPQIQQLLIINALLFWVYIIVMVLSAIYISQFSKNTHVRLDQIQMPAKLNVQYCEFLSLGWITLYGDLDVHRYSSFISESFYREANQYLNVNIYSDYVNMLSTLLYIEQRGLLDPFTVQFMSGEILPNTTLTYYLNLLMKRFKSVQSVLLRQSVVDEFFAWDLYFLRTNMVLTGRICQTLIDSLNKLFIEQLSLNQDVYVSLLCVSILLMLIFYFGQLYPCQQLKKYNERLLIINSRVYEREAYMLITRIEITKEILNKQANSTWRETNFPKLWFTPLEKEHVRYQGLKGSVRSSQDHSNNLKEKRKTSTNGILTGRIQHQQLPFKKPLILYFILFLFSFIYLVFGYFIFAQQNTALRPAQDIAMKIMAMRIDLNIMITTGLLVKSQDVVQNAIKKDPRFVKIKKEFLVEKEELLKTFRDLSQTFEGPLLQVYTAIYELKDFSEQDKQLLQDVFKKSLCTQIHDEIPYCQYDELGQTKFNSIYGVPEHKVDNILPFLSKGIMGVYANLHLVLSYCFEQEITENKYEHNEEEILRVLSSQQFNHGFIQYFTQTRKGTKIFSDTILLSMVDLLVINQRNLLLYIFICGIFLTLLSPLITTKFISKASEDTQLIILSLSNLPFEVLNEPQTMNLLKKI